MRKLLAIIAVLLPAVAHAQTQDVQQNISPFGEAAMYELTNIISLQSTFGTSTQRDVVNTANGGTVELDGGYLEVKADAQTGSTADLETVDRGQYQPGKGAETDIGVRVDIIRNTPTCALAKTDANTATVDATLRVTEEW